MTNISEMFYNKIKELENSSINIQNDKDTFLQHLYNDNINIVYAKTKNKSIITLKIIKSNKNNTITILNQHSKAICNFINNTITVNNNTFNIIPFLAVKKINYN